MAESFDRTKILIGQNGIEKLKKSSCIIFGVGGVGSFTVEALARCFVGNITLVDFDTVDITNINRQIHANINTVGKYKVELMYDRIKSINPKCNVKIFKTKVNSDNIQEFFKQKYDFVVDAIDDINAKIDIISYCKYNKLNIISSMGLANRLDSTKVYVGKLKNTLGCGIARKLRKRFPTTNLTVVASSEHAIKNGDLKGSISFVPSVGGLMIASHVVTKILKNK